MRARASRLQDGALRFFATESTMNAPSRWRSAGRKPTPASMARAGVATSPDPTVTRPLVSFRIPNATSATSAVPDPILPYSPTTSPFPIVRSRSEKAAPDDADSNDISTSVGSRLERLGPLDGADGPADHRGHEIVARVLGDGALEHGRAVPQDLHAIGDLDDLVEAMGDVDDRDAALAKAPDEREEPLDLLVGERRRRLVQDQAARLADERARDLDDLALGDAQARDRARPDRAARPSRRGSAARRRAARAT